MVVRSDEVHRIFLDEIAVVIIENPAVAMTGCLLSELMERKIKVIFCDRRHTPQGELVPYYGSHDSSRKLRTQIAWDDTVKGVVWGHIIAQKIGQQARFLAELGFQREAGILKGIGITLRDDYEDPLERLIDFMELVREFDRDKLFVLVGLRSFFANDRVELFLKTVLEHGYRVLLLDSIAREKLPSEKRLTIDNDPTRFSEEESGKYGYLH